MPRNRRILPSREEVAAFDRVQPDPSQVGGVAEAPFARLPDPATLFGARARRLRALSDGNVLADYLRFLAGVVEAQAAVVEATASPALPPADRLALAVTHGMPPLGGQTLGRPMPGSQSHDDGVFAATTAALLERADLGDAPQAAREAADAVRQMPAAVLTALATDVTTGSFPLDRVAETLFVTAALQVLLTRQAAQLDAASLPRADDGVCPACGGAPVSSLVVGWTQASKARYCACSLCGTLWNHVRIRCTACGSTEGIRYHTIEGGDPHVGVETCDSCQCYIKHMQQHASAGIDPVADDVASFALDLLAREEGFRRSSLNPLFLLG